MIILILYFRALLSDVILCFGFAFGFSLMIPTIFYLYPIPNTILTYSRSAVISSQFIIFNNLIDSDLGLAYVHHTSTLKESHQWSSSFVIHLTRYLLWQTHCFSINWVSNWLYALPVNSHDKLIVFPLIEWVRS